MQRGQRGNYQRGSSVASLALPDKFVRIEGSTDSVRVGSETAAQGGILNWLDAAQG